MKTRISHALLLAAGILAAEVLCAADPLPAPTKEMNVKLYELRKKALADPAVLPAYQACKAAQRALEVKVRAMMKETDPSLAPLIDKMARREPLAPEEQTKLSGARKVATATPALKEAVDAAKKAEAEMNALVWPKMKELDPSLAERVDEMQKRTEAAASGAAK